jgi:hypothetical protein
MSLAEKSHVQYIFMELASSSCALSHQKKVKTIGEHSKLVAGTVPNS